MEFSEKNLLEEVCIASMEQQINKRKIRIQVKGQEGEYLKDVEVTNVHNLRYYIENIGLQERPKEYGDHYHTFSELGGYWATRHPEEKWTIAPPPPSCESAYDIAKIIWESDDNSFFFQSTVGWNSPPPVTYDWTFTVVK